MIQLSKCFFNALPGHIVIGPVKNYVNLDPSRFVETGQEFLGSRIHSRVVRANYVVHRLVVIVSGEVLEEVRSSKSIFSC